MDWRCGGFALTVGLVEPSNALSRNVPAGVDAAVLGLWREFSQPLRAFVIRRLPSGLEPDDVMQEIFVRVQRGFDGLQDSGRARAWLFQIARNAVADALRLHARMDRDPGDADALPASDEPGLESSPESRLARCMGTMLERLDLPYREALQLVEIQGLSQLEAAARVGITLSAMKSRVQRGRVQLKAAYVACCRIDLDARGNVTDYEQRVPPTVNPACCRSPH
jgi:RNA polymerase sigma-70 factor (ECF subfamily)